MEFRKAGISVIELSNGVLLNNPRHHKEAAAFRSLDYDRRASVIVTTGVTVAERAGPVEQ